MTNQINSPENKRTRTELLVALRERFFGILHSPIALAIWVALTTLALVAEPFGTQGILPFWSRLIYWSVLIGLSILVGNLMDIVAEWMTPSGNPVWISAKAIGLMTLVFSPFVIYWGRVLGIWYPAMGAPPERLVFFVFVSTSAVFVLLAAIRPQLNTPTALSANPANGPMNETTRAVPRLAARLENPEARILRLCANNHLIEVVSETGREHVRMRFADAVTEMEPLEGICVHRSHWVALDVLSGVQRRKDKLFVVLSNGEEIPVSRTYRPQLEAARPDFF